MEFDKEHPIPQDISAYQFRLVGDMTIKQFMQVAAGALISLMIYSSGIPGYVKWPLIILSFLSGIALAFFPIEDRPLAKWISLFLKAIYSPTVYRWQSGVQRVDLFQPEPTAATAKASVNGNVPVAPSPNLNSSTTGDTESVTADQKDETDKLDRSEAELLSRVNRAFSNEPADVNIEKLIQENKEGNKKVAVPETANAKVETQVKELIPRQEANPNQTKTGTDVLPTQGRNVSNAKVATFSQQAAPPAPPTKANVVVGQVVDEEGNIVDNVILEIRDAQGRPVRALKSNRLGHFMIVTPLANGNYQMTAEKEGYQIDTINIEAKDQILPPIAIMAKKIG